MDAVVGPGLCPVWISTMLNLRVVHRMENFLISLAIVSFFQKGSASRFRLLISNIRCVGSMLCGFHSRTGAGGEGTVPCLPGIEPGLPNPLPKTLLL